MTLDDQLLKEFRKEFEFDVTNGRGVKMEYWLSTAFSRIRQEAKKEERNIIRKKFTQLAIEGDKDESAVKGLLLYIRTLKMIYSLSRERRGGGVEV